MAVKRLKDCTASSDFMREADIMGTLNNPNFMNQHHNFSNERYQPLPPSEVTCFKCGEKGHYANKCNKGVFAFLRSSMDHSNDMNDSDK